MPPIRRWCAMIDDLGRYIVDYVVAHGVSDFSVEWWLITHLGELGWTRSPTVQVNIVGLPESRRTCWWWLAHGCFLMMAGCICKQRWLVFLGSGFWELLQADDVNWWWLRFVVLRYIGFTLVQTSKHANMILINWQELLLIPKITNDREFRVLQGFNLGLLVAWDDAECSFLKWQKCRFYFDLFVTEKVNVEVVFFKHWV